jgi:hypothetical protein
MGVGVLAWDGSGDKVYESGVDHGVLYPQNSESGLYDDGFAWNGIYAVNEKPTGASPNPQYADNIKYLNLRSAEVFGGTLEAFTFPDAFAACDGSATPSPGVTVGGQGRQTFGLSYRTKIGDDVGGEDAGFKLHLVYGATASPTEKDYNTVNDSPAAATFSWDFDCIPVPVSGLKPTSLLVIDSTKVDPDSLTDLTTLLYGTSDTAPSLPMPDDVIALFSGDVTFITLTPATFNGAHTITIPTQTGVQYFVDNVLHAGGTQALTTGQTKIVQARANAGFMFNEPVVAEWEFTFVS